MEAALITTIQLEPALLVRILRHAGLATIGRLALTCTLMEVFIAGRRREVMDALIQTPWDEVQLIRRLRCNNTPVSLFDYPRIRAELERAAGHVGPPYTCITMCPDHCRSTFYCFMIPRERGVDFIRMDMAPSKTIVQGRGVFGRKKHYSRSLNDGSPSEIIIYGQCTCVVCKPLLVE